MLSHNVPRLVMNELPRSQPGNDIYALVWSLRKTANSITLIKLARVPPVQRVTKDQYIRFMSRYMLASQ